jgi:hypothetical protein
MVECDEEGWTTGRPGKDALLVPCREIATGKAGVISCSSCIGYPFDPFSDSTWRSITYYLEEKGLEVYYE